MMGVKNKIILVQAFLTLVLLGMLLYQTSQDHKIPEDGLLSPRVYAEVIEPKSYLVLNYDPLQEQLENFVEENHLNVSIYVENLRTGASFGVQEYEVYIPASISKVIVAILIMREIEQGELTLETKLPLLASDKDAMGTSVEGLSVSELLEKMLQESDNIALGVLSREIEEEDSSLLLYKYYGYYDQNDYYEDISEMTVNPLTIYNLYSSLYLSTVLEQEHSEYILRLLTNTTFPIHDIAQIPEDVIIAEKFGNRYEGEEKYFHDCGIMYINNSRIFYCVMTKDLEADLATEVIGTIVHRIYTYSVETRSELDSYKATV